jgi:GntR family transcriptional regulator
MTQRHRPTSVVSRAGSGVTEFVRDMDRESKPQPVAAGAPRRALIDPTSRVPLYHQILIILRNQIFSGELRPGAALPGEQELAERFDVSRITAKRALNELADAGLAVRERGRGTRVSDAPPAPTVKTSVEGWLENISLMGVATDVEVLEFDYVPALAEVAEALLVAQGAIVQRTVRVRSLDGEPMSHLVTYVPEDIGRSFDRDEMGNFALLTLMERHGVKVADARQSVTATLAEPEVARALAIHAGSPLIDVRRIVRDVDDRPVEFIRVLYRPDKYQFEMNLKRVRRREGMQWQSLGPGSGRSNDK